MNIISRCFSKYPIVWICTKLLISLMLITNAADLNAQGSYTIQGKVTDTSQEPLPGVTITVVGRPGVGVTTDIDGNYRITLQQEDTALEFSFIGMETQRINVRGRSVVNVAMNWEVKTFDEVVVVGYGQQKRVSVVGAITQTTGATLERAGGVTSVGAALTGNLPGVVTTQSSGMPGAEDPRIQIRAASTWNNSEPLVLVDGVERPLSSVDINSIQGISVLKDASATAVFGVQGANGVILITTKRGAEGRAVISAAFNSTMKTASKLPNKYDAYDALLLRNRVIEYELASTADSWSAITPYETIRKYRFPADQTERERYPNVDWQDALFKDQTMSYNANINVAGGTRFVKYFANMDYISEGDLFREYQSTRAYSPGFGFDRINMRSNLDFRITSSTLLKLNLGGSHGIRKGPWGNLDNANTVWASAYVGAPDLFWPQYSNGLFGFYGPNPVIMTNSVRNLAVSGIEYQTTTSLTTDFVLEQDLNMFIKGLNFRGAVAIDNRFLEGGRGVDDRFTEPNLMWVNPDTGDQVFMFNRTGFHGFDYPDRIMWSTPGGGVQNWRTFRRSDYQTQLNYVTNIANRHDITAMGTFERKQEATGSEVLRVRENWVFRTTYSFDNKYSFEYNGSYNGSEKFASAYRFAFFSSGGVGWMISEENFMKSLTFIDLLRLRASYGTIGDDSYASRFLYMDSWARRGRSAFQETGWNSGWDDNPRYGNAGGIGEWFYVSSLGNPDMQWETVTKANVGTDFAFFDGFLAGSFELFQDERDNIIVGGANRAVPSYFGMSPPTANTGKVKANGYELELRLSHRWVNGTRFWSNFAMTHAKNKIIIADEPQLLPDHMKNEGKMVNQTRSYLSNGFYGSWDELYATTPFANSDQFKLPGNYYIMDFNADGVIDSYDVVPFSYPTVPLNTYSSTIGFEWKGFSTFVQFYGVNNVTRPVYYNSFAGSLNSVFNEGTWWSKNESNPDVETPSWRRTPDGAATGNKVHYDASYLRLKNAEIGYTFNRSSRLISNTGINSLRIFVNGNNLWIWTKMPDDRESNFATTNPGQGAYPTVKRFNLGVNVAF